MSRWIACVVAALSACAYRELPPVTGEDAATADARSIADAPDVDGAGDDAAALVDAQPDAQPDARPDAVPDAVPDARPDAAPDAAPDARMGPTVTGVDIPARIATGDTVDVRVTIHALTHGAVAWSLHATAGAFAPATGSADLDASGNAVFTASYTAAAAAGDDAFTIDLDDGESTHGTYTARVGALVPLGEAAAFADHAGLTVVSDIAYGQQVVLAAPAYAMRFGLFVDNAGYTGRLALYLDHGASPATKVAETALQALAVGRNELRIAVPVRLNPGTYWLMGNFSAGAQVRRSAAVVAQLYLPAAATAALPDSTAGATAINAKTLNYFLEVIP